MTPTVTKELIIRLENNQIPGHEKSPPLSLSVKRRRWEFTFFFFSQQSCWTSLVFIARSTGNDGTVFNGSSLPQSANKKDNAVEFHRGDHFERFKVTLAGGQGLLSAPSTVNESHWTSKGAINKQTLARPLIANGSFFIWCFPSGSKCSNVKTGSISRRAAVRSHCHWYNRWYKPLRLWTTSPVLYVKYHGD